jgi:autotransporter-associated beta strand protein
VGAAAILGTNLTVSSEVTLGMPVTVGMLVFDNPSVSYTLAGLGTLTTQNTGSPAIIVASGSHTVSVPVVLAGAGDTIVAISRSGDSLVLNGAVSGTRGLTKSGAGVLNLPNIGNSYLGGANVTDGSLQGNAASIRGNVLLSNNADVTFFQSSDGQYVGTISGIGSLIKTGPRELTLSGSNSFTDGTTVTLGTLVIAKANALPPGGPLTIGANGTLVLDSGLSAGAVGAGTAAPANAVPEPDKRELGVLH